MRAQTPSTQLWRQSLLVAGAAQSPEDKLATLQVFYPDAMRVEDLDPQNGAMEFGYGNFAFTNPETGKLTLYDEFK